MAKNEMVMCPNQEDLKVLAAMAAANSFRPLIEGFVALPYMSEEPRKVGQWILDTYASRERDSWPPSLRALQAQFPHLDWPMDLERATNLHTDPFVERFLVAARSYQSMTAAISAMAIGEIKDENERQEALFQAHAELHKFGAIGKSNTGGRRIGSDMDAMLASILGTNSPASYINTPWQLLNTLVKNFYSGIYGFFSRPGNGKSWALLRIACHNAVTQKLEGVLVDVENDEALFNTRIACQVGGLHFPSVEAMKARLKVPGYVGKNWELTQIAMLAQATEKLHDEGKLFLLGKEDMDKETQRMSTATILRACDMVGALHLNVDQFHKYFVPGVTKDHHQDSKRIMQVANTFDAQGIVTFATTQENREGEPKDKFFNWHSPSSKYVYGSDGLMQLSQFLAHLRTFELGMGGALYKDWREERTAKFLTCFWPIKNRSGDGDSLDHRLWRLSDNCCFEEIYNNAKGTAIVDAEIQRRRLEYGYDDRRGGRGRGGRNNGPQVPVGRGPIQSPRSRYGE